MSSKNHTHDAEPNALFLNFSDSLMQWSLCLPHFKCEFHLANAISQAITTQTQNNTHTATIPTTNEEHEKLVQQIKSFQLSKRRIMQVHFQQIKLKQVI